MAERQLVNQLYSTRIICMILFVLCVVCPDSGWKLWTMGLFNVLTAAFASGMLADMAKQPRRVRRELLPDYLVVIGWLYWKMWLFRVEKGYDDFLSWELTDCVLALDNLVTAVLCSGMFFCGYMVVEERVD
jgi:hypothetical protein